MNYTRTNYLALLQQMEYDLELFRDWPDIDGRRSAALQTHLYQISPEKWTQKLKLIARISSSLFGWMSPRTSVALATRLVSSIDLVTKGAVVWLAARKLRAAQRKGLTIIAIAGSYGKTSTKMSLAHVLGAKQSVFVARGSVNTPVGLARHIQNLRSDHRIYIAELGEQVAGDNADLMRLLQPDVVVITPIGHAHTGRHRRVNELVEMFHEVTQARQAPPLALVHIANKELLMFSPKTKVEWYGHGTQWSFSSNLSAPGHQEATLHTPTQNIVVESPISSIEQLNNALPAFVVSERLGYDIKELAISLRYQPSLERRWQVHQNPNGSWFIDNSYNTNPATWKESVRLFESWNLGPTAFITAGFVEMKADATQKAHLAMAQDLLRFGTVVILIETLSNQDLIQAVKSGLTEKQQLVVVPHAAAALEKLRSLKQPVKAVWWEGGVREMYQ